jgi:protein kinase-like protein/AAA ATPase-like protein
VQIGPYDIEGTLGEGGMGVVYRAHRHDTGQRAALKTVRLPKPALLASLRREIQRLERLRHPGVVRVLDHGVHEGLPWYAMELLEGSTWRDRFPRRSSTGPDGLAPSIAVSRPDHGDAITRDGWGRGPSPQGDVVIGEPITDEEIPELCRVTRRLCDALAYIHGEGVVHRDLKPENVLLRAGGDPTLLDFGLVVEHSGAAGREVLDVEAILAGTAAFMAPEQIFGELVDARADVFALGCMLYESLTGRLPFPSTLHDRKRCWDLAPPPPSRLAPAVPRALDQLVLEMLRNDPRDRIGHASDVAAALDRHLGLAASAAAPAYVYRSRYAGRDDVLEALTARVVAVKNLRGGRVLVEGESGSGKTRLVLEAVRRAGTEGLNMVGCECAPFDASGGDENAVGLPPLSPLRPLLRMVADRCRTVGPRATERLLGARLPILRALEPSLALVPGAGELPDPPPLPPEAAKHRVLEAMADTLRALAATSPVLLLIDDLQWADNLTLELIAHLDTKRLANAPVLIIATCRSEQRIEAIEAFAGAADVQRIPLLRLDDSTVGVLIADILAVKSPPPELVRFIADRADGNPFFVNEYLRTAVAEGILCRTADARWALAGDDHDGKAGWAARLETLGLPRTLREIVARRLAELDAGLLELVTTAAVLGREVDCELLARLCPRDERSFADALNELSRRNVLAPSTGSRYRFTHDKLREGAAEAIPPTRKQALHRAIAEAYEARGVTPEELATLAHHWAHADHADKARVYLRLAGEQALQAGAHQEAAPLFARAIELADATAAPLGPDGPARLHQRHADALWGLGDTHRGAREAEAALALMGVRVPASAAGVAAALGRQLVEQVGRVAFGRRPSSPTDEELALARAESAVRLSQCYFAAQRPPAQAMYATLLAANLAERAGLRGPKSVPFAHLGAAAGMVGLEKLAHRYFARARADADARHDPAAFAEAGIMEASHYYAGAQWDALDRSSERDLAIAESVGDRPAWEGLMLVTGGAALLRGRLDDAATRLEKVRGSAGARAGHYMNAWATTLLSVHELWRRRADSARELAAAARRDFRQDGGVAVANATAVRAAAWVLTGEREAAIAEADETLALLERGPLLYFMWPACDTTMSALLELWQTARDRAEAGPLRQRALQACRFARALGARCAIGKPIALRAAAAAALLDGRTDRARSLYRAAGERARALLLPIVEAQVGHESARLDADEGEPG